MADNKELKDVICLDIASLPNGFDIQKFMYVLEKHNVALYDSSLGGLPPHVINEVDTKYIAIDINTLTEDQIKSLTQE